VTLKNRIVKSAMTEGLADEYNRATEKHVRLYRQWSRGAGCLITGNVQIDRRYVERSGNVAIDGPQSEDQVKRLKAFASAAMSNGNHCWMQIGHAGRQCDTRVNTSPVGPSNVPVRVLTKPVFKTRALSEEEIMSCVRKFAFAASTAKACGFSGVQIHSAHGYLLSSFLSPLANQRTDRFGGSLKNRARFLMLTIRAVRQAVGRTFPVSVKLNSADFQRGGFSHAEAVSVARMLDDENLDLLEISGGNYENPVLILGTDEKDQSSTALREAYFLKYSRDIKQAMVRTPLMVTGGFRSRSAMDSALSGGYCDIIGIARPLCGDPQCVEKMLSGAVDALPSWERMIKAPWLLEQLASSLKLLRLAKHGLGLQMWYYANIIRMGEGKRPDLQLSLFSAMRQMAAYEERKSASLLGLDDTVGTALHAKRDGSLPIKVMAIALFSVLIGYAVSYRARI